jgi:hypothetical protein
MTVYTFKKIEDTNEIHIFRGEMNNDNTCSVASNSICQKVMRSETVSLKRHRISSSETIYCSCNEEHTARLNAAKIGREVCGVCVSHLYTTY